MAECESSPVYLGFTENAIKDHDRVNWLVNKIGGSPLFSPQVPDDFLHDMVDTGLKCSKCLEPCIFLGQISSPVDEKPVDRVIYFFACQRNKCDHFVAVRFVTPTRNQSPSSSASDRVWGDDGDGGWSTGDEDLSDEGGHDGFAESSASDDSNCDCKTLSTGLDQIAAFKPYFIGVDDEEDLERDKRSSRRPDLLQEMPIAEAGGDNEKYENIELQTVFNNDRTSYKFYKKLRDFPDQLIRYSWKGEPFLNKSGLELNTKGCDRCGSPRIFECQLMPGLINALKPISSNQSKSPQLDYGTVLVYTCSNNCTNSVANYEQCIPLNEPENDIIEEFLSKS